MSEAPKEIFLRRWQPGSGMEVFAERCYNTDIAYIRKDLYDVVCKELEQVYKLILSLELSDGSLIAHKVVALAKVKDST